MFRTDASVDVDKSRETLWQENRLNFQQGAYGDPSLPQTQLIFWQNMERAHYPWAADNVERIKGEIERQNEIAQLKGRIAELEPMAAQVPEMQTEIENRAGYAAYLAGELAKRGGRQA